ncbi:MAG: GvpL/GvpF family gas vesicle protein [Gemmatimonadaceae bacterium]
MAIYLYCLLRSTIDPPADLLGVDDLTVQSVEAGTLRAWVSEIEQSTITPSAERARAHDGVVRTAMSRETPLPARFGQVVADHAALEESVSPHSAAFQAALDAVAGAVEMTVRVLVSGARGEAGRASRAVVGEGTGRAYLERLAATHRQERNVLAEEQIVRDRVSSAVRSLVRAESFAGARPGSTIATLSHLVTRERVDAYRSAIQVLRTEDPALVIMVSGPWAPYSFTQVGGP